MASIYLTEHARTDLLDIWRYIADHDLEAADRLIAAIEEHYRVLEV
jgi:plasmid stabilization system protein ParE